MHERAGERETLLDAAGKRAGVHVLLPGELEDLDDLLPPRRDLVGRHEVHLGEELDVLVDREVVVERELLRHVADARLHAVGVLHDVDAVDGGRSLARREQATEHPDRRRLAGAVRAEESEDAPSRHLEVEVIDGDEVAEPTHEAAALDGEIAHDALTSWT